MKYFKLYIIFMICIGLFVVSNVYKSFENDTFFTINTGNYILQNGIDDIEPFTFHENLKFVKLRWGFDILVSFLYNSFGFYGLYYFTLFMSVLLACIIYTILVKFSGTRAISFVLALLIIIVCSKYYVCRAQIISYIIFVLEVYYLFKLSSASDFNKKYSIILVALSVLLLIFHSSVWIVYLAFFAPFIAEGIVYKFFPSLCCLLKNKFEIKSSNLKNISIVFLIVVLTGFITPLQFSPYTYSFRSFSTIASKLIIELKSVIFYNNYALAFYISLIAFIFALFFIKCKIRIADVFYIAGCLILSFMALRNFMVCFPIICICFGNIIKNYLESTNLEKRYDEFEKFLCNNLLAKLALIFLFIIYFGVKYPKIEATDFIPKDQYPVDAVSFIKNNVDISKMRLYNDFTYGSYIEFQGVKAFIDSRSEIFCKEFNNVTILEDWYKVFGGTAENIGTNLMPLINKYDITHIISLTNSELVKYLRNENKHNEIYSDEFFTVFEL